MKEKQREYGILGFLIGAVESTLLGFFSLNQVKKSMRADVLPWTVAAGAAFVGIGGYGMGSRMGKQAYIEERLGIDTAEEGYTKYGRYWVGITKWTDKRDGKQYTLLTARSNQKFLVSALNDRIIVKHDCQSAARDTVPRYHTQAKNHVWSLMKENYQEQPIEEEKLLPSLT
jgi:hypothetical protein